MEIVPNDRENLVEDLVEIERGQYRLTGVVKDGDSLHNEPMDDGVGENKTQYYITARPRISFCTAPKFRKSRYEEVEPKANQSPKSSLRAV